MQETDRICPIDGHKLFASSGPYQDTWYDCFGCGAHYASLTGLEEQARAYISKVESDVQRHRGELEKKESKLERITADAKAHGLIE